MKQTLKSIVQSGLKKKYTQLLCVALSFGIFLTEPFTQLGFAHGFLYVPVLVLCEKYCSHRFLRLLGVLVVFLIIVGYFISPPPPDGFDSIYVMLNRLGALTTVISFVWLVSSYQRKIIVEQSSSSELQRRQAQFETLVENLPIQIWTATPQGEVNYVGTKLENYSGKSKDEILSDWLAVVHPDDRQETVKIWQHAIETSEPYVAEFRLLSKSGEYLWHLTSAVPEYDQEGHVIRWLGSSVDIDRIKVLEKEAKVAQERFHLIGLATNDTIWDWDFTSNEVWWNSGFFTMFGYDPTEVETGPESWSNRIYPADRESITQSIHEVIENSEVTQWKAEYRFLHKSGKPLYVSDRGVIIRDKNGIAQRMVGSMIDLTEKVEREEKLRQSQKLESIGQLTGGIAHDFNNLLTVIMGNSETLVERFESDSSTKSLAEMILSASIRGAELTNRLLSFARKQALEPLTIDVNKVIANFEPLLRRTLIEDIEVEVIKSGGLWKAEIDIHQLESALLNLCINSRDVMTSGGLLTIETANAWLDDTYAAQNSDVVSGQYIMISVSDTGTGMSNKTIQKAFDPFFTTKESGKGTGLGLSMVYGFVKQSGGHIKIYSELGEGTTVKMYFPRAHSAAQAADIDYQPSQDSPAFGEKILVVEDDELVRQNLVQQLESLNYNCDNVASGEDALKLLESDRHYDLLFTDVVMPGGINGRKLADIAVKLRPQLKVLFTSGYTENAIVHHGRLDLGVHLISKPYRKKELAEKLRKVLNDKS